MNNDMYTMIQNGAFGTSSPIVNNGFNPYQNSNISNNYYQYQQPNYGYNYGYNQYQQPNYSYNNGYNQYPQSNYYNQYQQPNYGYSYGYNQYPQQSINNYYNPYADLYQQSNYGYNYGYNQYPQTGYGYFCSPVAMQKYRDDQITMLKIKHRMINKYFNRDVNEEELDKICNPSKYIQLKTDEEIKQEQEDNFIRYASNIANGIIPEPPSSIKRNAYLLNLAIENYHKELDGHSLYEFLENDLWKLEREEWIRNNVKLNSGRDFSGIYNSNDYNELLRLHSSASNSYMNDILNNSRYDNNVDDMEIGMNIAFEKARRRKNILEGKVPDFISSNEVQERRHKWTKAVLDQIYNKGSKINV